MGRKSSVIAVLQKLKPCIIEKYAYFLVEKKDDESAVNDEKQSTSAKAMPTGTQKVNSKNVMTCKATVPKSIWQGRVKRGGQQRLPTIPEVKEVPKEYIDRCNQVLNSLSLSFSLSLGAALSLPPPHPSFYAYN